MGDLVYHGANGGTHVELVVSVSAGSLQTIGGNTSGSVDGKTFFNGTPPLDVDGERGKETERRFKAFAG